jgi:hypothetical protein
VDEVRGHLEMRSRRGEEGGGGWGRRKREIGDAPPRQELAAPNLASDRPFPESFLHEDGTFKFSSPEICALSDGLYWRDSDEKMRDGPAYPNWRHPPCFGHW